MNRIKLIIFDLDGVLCDMRDAHYQSLNRALEKLGYDPISMDRHLSKFDGLNTKKKLSILKDEYNLGPGPIQEIFESKQQYTKEIINEMQFDTSKRLMLRKLQEEGYTLAVASNSIRESVRLMLLRCGFIEYIDFFYSNEDVRNPKPAAEIYLKCMIKAGVSPKETLIIEDSKHGRESAYNSGANLLGVTGVNGVTYDNVRDYINHLENNNKPQKWSDNKLNVVIPMAGRGSRFEQVGYTFPKPLIDVHGDPMIKMVVDNLAIEAHYIYICQKEHYEKYNLKTLLNLITPNCDIIQLDHITEGAACTVLKAEGLIDNDNPLIIVNSDQYMVWDSSDFMWNVSGDKTDAALVTFTATHPKWSFAEVDDRGLVTRVAEKDPISNNASTGLYYYSKGQDFVKYANQMISKNIRTNNEFYVCPVLNEFIGDGKRVKNYHIDKFYGTGTPEDLNYFLQTNK